MQFRQLPSEGRYAAQVSMATRMDSIPSAKSSPTDALKFMVSLQAPLSFSTVYVVINLFFFLLFFFLSQFQKKKKNVVGRAFFDVVCCEIFSVMMPTPKLLRLNYECRIRVRERGDTHPSVWYERIP